MDSITSHTIKKADKNDPLKRLSVLLFNKHGTVGAYAPHAHGRVLGRGPAHSPNCEQELHMSATEN